MKDIPNVAIEHCMSYNSDELFSVISKIACAADFPEVKNKSVLLKPNILSDAPVEDCITTNPEVVRAVIRLVKEKGASKIIVGDSPGLHKPGFKAEICKIGLVCKEENVEFVDFTKHSSLRKLKNSNVKVQVTDYAFETDVVISLSKFKTHMLMYTTGSVKNLFGTIPSINKSQCHLLHPSKESFAKFIVSLYETIEPDFCIMDAVIGMEGPGPANGNARPVNLLLGSKSCMACDWAQALIMGYQPETIPILREGLRRNLVSKWINYPLLDPNRLIIRDYKRIEIKNQTNFFRTLIVPFFTRGFQKKKQKSQPAPEFNHEKCIHCLKCVNICPAKALCFKDKQIVISYDKCIRCYCCHEMCPEDAIDIKTLNFKEN